MGGALHTIVPYMCEQTLLAHLRDNRMECTPHRQASKNHLKHCIYDHVFDS